MGYLMFLLLFGFEVASEGWIAAVLGLASALGVDVAGALITGAGLASVFRGAGLVDDMVFMLAGVNWKLKTKIYATVFTEQFGHVMEEAYEQWSHTDAQNRRYAAYLQRQNPGATYVFGDVSHVDLFELGYTGYKVYKSKQVRDAFTAVANRFSDFLGLEETADTLAIGVEFI